MNLLRKIFGKKPKSEISINESEESSYFPKDGAPIDEKFTYIFNKNGGKFLYCLSMDEVLESFQNILEENKIAEEDIYCINQQLGSKFNSNKFNFKKEKENSFFLTTCESLIAKNGSILFSSNQIKEKKLNELPSKFIVFATTSQLTDTISEGMRKIKNQSKNLIPSNITTIQDFETNKEKDFMSYGSSTKNLYLLLLEDL
ncbi:MAG: lactate utilization protein B/C [Flavobacteriaceae bacterium]|nr:lactate utilization protein B/C [Flavobacteriaceae bacterium]MDG1329861.1 LUD domain-containing protein [Flavobacteriaceae bacterium]|tara:strand:+ start:19016 stop:19618 length:603 start_codon:yes stop_codon:yes gene_type:complete